MTANAQQQAAATSQSRPEVPKAEIRTTKLADGVYMLESQNGNITVATAKALFARRMVTLTL